MKVAWNISGETLTLMPLYLDKIGAIDSSSISRNGKYALLGLAANAGKPNE
jgi:hypothetical protein